MARRNPNTRRTSSQRRTARVNRARELEVGVTSLTDKLLPRNTDESAQLVTADRLLPARVYEGLQAGPNWSRTYETQVGIPIDAGRGISRDSRFGSPFTFRVLPNQTLVNSLLSEDDHAGVNIISAAQGADSTFANYTAKLDALRQSDAFPGVSAFPSIENFIAEGILIDKHNIGDPANIIPAVADTRTQADVLLQLLQMLNTPPLTLLINPQSLTISHAKKQIYTDRSRSNHIFQSWGEEQVKLSVSGKTGAFMVGDPPSNFHTRRGSATQITETATATGVQFAAKRDSAAFQNLMNLLLFYRNNGYIYDRIGRSEAHLWIGSIAIDYDQFTYVGNFESFEYSYANDKQNGGIEFSFDFTASRIFDSAQRSFFVDLMQSPVPSPSDSQWSVPGPRRRSPGKGLLGPFDALRKTPKSKPSPTAEGRSGGGGGTFDPSPPPGSVRSATQLSGSTQGFVRGGEF